MKIIFRISLFLSGVYLLFTGFNMLYFKNLALNTNNPDVIQTLATNISPASPGVYVGYVVMGIFLIVASIFRWYKDFKKIKK